MKFRNSRYVRMGSRIGAGIVVGAVLAVVPLSPSSATHLTSITLDGATVPVGTPSVTLTGHVHSECEGSDPTYGYQWSLSSPSGSLTPSSSPGGTGTADTDYTLTLNPSSLSPGVYTISVRVDFYNSVCNIINGDPGFRTANATLRISGRNGSFSCRAYAARTPATPSGTGTDYQPSNTAYNPCKDDINYFGQVQPIAGLGNIGVTRTFTDQQPNVLSSAPPNANDYADAHAHIAGVDLTIAGTRIRTGAVWARSAVNCQGLGMTPKKNSDGTVVGVQIAGRAFGTSNDYLKVVIGGLTVEINKTTNTTTSTQRQGILITYRTLTTTRRWVIGETKAGWTGNPCQGV